MTINPQQYAAEEIARLEAGEAEAQRKQEAAEGAAEAYSDEREGVVLKKQAMIEWLAAHPGT